MDSIFLTADVQCQLAGPANLEETLYEQKMLERRKLRPCVATGVDGEAIEDICYLLCPMAGFHEGEGVRAEGIAL